MSQLGLSDSFYYLCYVYTAIRIFFTLRVILTSKVDARTGRVKSLILRTKYVFIHQHLQMFGLKLNICEDLLSTSSCGAQIR